MNLYMALPFVLGRIEKDGKILLGKQPMLERKPYPGHWDLPSGKVEPFESIHDAIKREVKEETNLDVIYAEIFDIYHHHKGKFTNEYTSDIPSVGICFDIEFEGNFIPQEMDDMQWVEYEKVKDLKLAPWSEFFLQDLLKK